MEAPETETFREMIKSAEGVLICPELLRGAFLWGASYGNGLFFVKERKGNSWVGPSFHTLGGISFGFQAGGQVSEIILLVMTRRGVRALQRDGIKLGADVGVAIGPVGIGASAATQNLSADIIAFAKSKGLFGGIALDGAFVKVRNDLNEAFYGKKVSPYEILILKKVTNRDSAIVTNLLSTLVK